MDLFWRQLASLLGPPGPPSPLVSTIASPQLGERRILLRASDQINHSGSMQADAAPDSAGRG